MLIAKATHADRPVIWSMLEPVIRTGTTYALARNLSEGDALAYWLGCNNEVYLAERDGQPVGTYYLRANHQGGGAHVANCGYVSRGGAARVMCGHSLDRARERGFKAMQFNFVVSSNTRALRIWQDFGFDVVGTLPRAFDHPELGLVDAFVMHREL